MFNILSWIFGTGALLSLFLIYQQKERKKLLLCKLSADLCWVVHYLCLSAFGGAIYALEQTKHFEPLRHNNYVLLQVHYSLRLMYDLSYEPEFKSDCMALMISLAEYGEKSFIRLLKTAAD